VLAIVCVWSKDGNVWVRSVSHGEGNLCLYDQVICKRVGKGWQAGLLDLRSTHVQLHCGKREERSMSVGSRSRLRGYDRTGSNWSGRRYEDVSVGFKTHMRQAGLQATPLICRDLSRIGKFTQSRSRSILSTATDHADTSTPKAVDQQSKLF
jgi:hypothetical protein